MELTVREFLHLCHARSTVNTATPADETAQEGVAPAAQDTAQDSEAAAPNGTEEADGKRAGGGADGSSMGGPVAPRALKNTKHGVALGGTRDAPAGVSASMVDVLAERRRHVDETARASLRASRGGSDSSAGSEQGGQSGQGADRPVAASLWGSWRAVGDAGIASGRRAPQNARDPLVHLASERGPLGASSPARALGCCVPRAPPSPADLACPSLLSLWVFVPTRGLRDGPLRRRHLAFQAASPPNPPSPLDFPPAGPQSSTPRVARQTPRQPRQTGRAARRAPPPRQPAAEPVLAPA